MIKAIIFDFDDTLVKTKECKWDALKETGKRFYNLEISDEHINKFWGQPFDEMLSGVLMNCDKYVNLKNNYESVTQEFPMKAFDDAVSVIDKLLEKYKIGILSSSSKLLLMKDMALLNFPVDKFFYIQTYENTQEHKPHPEVFSPILTELKTLGIDKKELIYVGNAVIDLEAAKSAGLKFCAILSEENVEDFENIKKIKDLEEIKLICFNSYTDFQNVLDSASLV
ncbi:MAG TPA: HAD-IA family hydrolase [Candidatus Limnocylindrales bacterium]|nr:HAD-IA family hydrolase [Candidatus Limnocylindrales bacterium]